MKTFLKTILILAIIGGCVYGIYFWATKHKRQVEEYRCYIYQNELEHAYKLAFSDGNIYDFAQLYYSNLTAVYDANGMDVLTDFLSRCSGAIGIELQDALHTKESDMRKNAACGNKVTGPLNDSLLTLVNYLVSKGEVEKARCILPYFWTEYGTNFWALKVLEYHSPQYIKALKMCGYSGPDDPGLSNR